MLWECRLSGKPLPEDVKKLPVPQDLDKIVKRPTDSFLTVILPFGTDPDFRRRFTNFKGLMRVGKLLEELDSFCGNVAYMHCDDGRADIAPPTLVTASFDRMDLLRYPLNVDEDLQLRGMVTYCGKSSMNVEMELSSIPKTAEEEPVPFLLASCTFVARDSQRNAAIPVPRLQPESELEMELHEQGRRSQEGRKEQRAHSLSRMPPTPEELSAVHRMLITLGRGDGEHPAPLVPVQQAGKVGGGSGSNSASEAAGGTSSSAPSTSSDTCLLPRAVWSSSTRISSTHITQPDLTNIHSKVFGGHIMREAFEQAFLCAWLHLGEVPKFLSLDDVFFLHSVEVGCLLRYDAQIVYSPGLPEKTFAVAVEATVIDPAARHPLGNGNGNGSGSGSGSGKGDDSGAAAAAAAAAGAEASKLTNTFFFTFYCDTPQRIPRVYPRSYAEAMGYIEASRRWHFGKALAEKRRAEQGHVRSRFGRLGR